VFHSVWDGRLSECAYNALHSLLYSEHCFALCESSPTAERLTKALSIELIWYLSKSGKRAVYLLVAGLLVALGSWLTIGQLIGHRISSSVHPLAQPVAPFCIGWGYFPGWRSLICLYIRHM